MCCTGSIFAVARGETIALMGRNGMGKTTLLRALMGLVPQRRGRVMLGAHDVIGRGARDDRARRRRLRAGGARHLRLAHRDGESRDGVARRRRTGARAGPCSASSTLFPRLAERRHHWGNQLSGGEQQMLTSAAR